MIDALEARTREFFEVSDDQPTVQSHLDYAEAMVASGIPLLQLSKDLGVDRETLRRYLCSLDPEHANERMSRARENGGHALAEEGLEIVDADASTAVEVSRAVSRARHRGWLAERWNPGDLGVQKGANVVINVTQLHLAALQTVPGRVTGASETHLLEGNNSSSVQRANAQVVGTMAVGVSVR